MSFLDVSFNRSRAEASAVNESSSLTTSRTASEHINHTIRYLIDHYNYVPNLRYNPETDLDQSAEFLAKQDRKSVV